MLISYMPSCSKRWHSTQYTHNHAVPRSPSDGKACLNWIRSLLILDRLRTLSFVCSCTSFWYYYIIVDSWDYQREYWRWCKAGHIWSHSFQCCNYFSHQGANCSLQRELWIKETFNNNNIHDDKIIWHIPLCLVLDRMKNKFNKYCE